MSPLFHTLGCSLFTHAHMLAGALTRWPEQLAAARRATHAEGHAPSGHVTLHKNSPRHYAEAAYFASFSFGPQVAPYVLEYLRALQEAKLDIVFISTSPLSTESVAQLAPFCRTILEKANEGLDFASWQAGLAQTNMAEGYTSLLLANDSVFGPFTPLRPLIDRMNAQGYDVWGLLDNHQLGWHLQSYFLWVNAKVLASSEWRTFWEDIRILKDKRDIIFLYEVGFSRLFQKRFKLGSWATYRSVVPFTWQVLRNKPWPRRMLALLTFRSPAVFSEILIRDFSFPFLKRDIFKTTNREAYRHITPDISGLVPRSTYPFGHISTYLDDLKTLTNGAFSKRES